MDVVIFNVPFARRSQMNEQFDQFSHSIDFFRNLGVVTLSGSQELIAWQFDSAQALIALGSQQLRTVLSDARATQEREQWSEAVPTGLRNAIQMTRDCLLAVSDYQMDGLRLLQKQAAEARQLLSDSLSEQSPNIKLLRAGDKKSGKTTSVYFQQRAA